MTREQLLQKLKDEDVPQGAAEHIADELEASGELLKLEDESRIIVKREVTLEKLYPTEKKHFVDKDGNLCVGGE